MLLFLHKSSIIISEKRSQAEKRTSRKKKNARLSTKIIADDTLSSRQNDANPSRTLKIKPRAFQAEYTEKKTS